MPNLTTQPTASFLPVGNLDGIRYGLAPAAGEYTTSAGVNPYVILTFDGTPQGGNGNITLFGQTYTVQNSPTDHQNINLFSSSAHDHAYEVAVALNANGQIYPYLESLTVSQMGANWKVEAIWHRPEMLSNVLDTSGLATPLAGASGDMGMAEERDGGFRLAYQFFVDGMAATSMRHVAPVVLPNGTEGETIIDFRQTAALNVKTTLPFTKGVNPWEDLTFAKPIFLRYGSQTSDGETTQWGGFADSNTKKAINVALPVGLSLSSYTPFDPLSPRKGEHRFLTLSPRLIEICEDEKRWLWLVFSGDAGDPEPVNAYNAVYTLTDINGVVTQHSKPVSKEGIVVIPCGTGNFPFVLDNIVKYTVNVQYEKSIGGVESTETFTFQIKSCDCAEPFTELYFQEPLGGYTTLPLFKVDTVRAENESGTFENPIDPTASDWDKRTQGGISIHSPKSFLKIDLTVRVRFTNTTYQYIQHLRSTKNRFIRYKVGSVDEIWKFIPENGSIDIYKHEDWVFCRMSGTVHLPMAYVENGI